MSVPVIKIIFNKNLLWIIARTSQPEFKQEYLGHKERKHLKKNWSTEIVNIWKWFYDES